MSFVAHWPRLFMQLLENLVLLEFPRFLLLFVVSEYLLQGLSEPEFYGDMVFKF